MSYKLTTQEMNRLTVDEFRASQKIPLTVVLDNVRSQNNIGSVFRTADAFRVGRIVLCGICSTPPHREIHKTALGAEESVDWSYCEDTVDCVRALKEQGYRIYAVELAHNSLNWAPILSLPTVPWLLFWATKLTGCRRRLWNFATER